MKSVIEILNSHFKICQILIENFTILNKSVETQIRINSEEFGTKTIILECVSNININSDYYFCSDRSSIIIEDLSSAQIEGVKYKVAVAEDSMTFYCQKIILN